jgi:hypothetical protein
MFHHSLIESIKMTKGFTKKQLPLEEFYHVHQLLNNRYLFRKNIFHYGTFKLTTQLGAID